MSGEIRGKYGAGNKVNTKYKRSNFFSQTCEGVLIYSIYFVLFLIFFFFFFCCYFKCNLIIATPACS